ncbi:MAG TPA: M20 family peptidase, partial [Candidatus Limnocylindria bacterium]
MPDIAALRKRAQNAIDQRRDALFELSRAIHANPETAYEERKAVARLSEFLEKSGFKVERGYRGVETSYRGDAPGKNGGPRVAILAEY